MDHIAFEQLDNDNLDMALGAYTVFPAACKAHMMKTVVFDWKLRTYPAFCKAFPEDSMELNAQWTKLKEGADGNQDTVLSHEEWTMLKTCRGSTLQPVLDKIAADPKYEDVLALLTFTRQTFNPVLTSSYTREVHAKLVALKEPLKTLIHDLDDKNKAVTEPPVRAIGMELHVLGGLQAQQAVYYAIGDLLYDEEARYSDGDLWSNAPSSLNIAWNGCGQWVA